MRDQLVSTITNLCDILKDRTTLLEATEDMAVKAVDLGADLQQDLDQVRADLYSTRQRAEDAEYALREAQRRERNATFHNPSHESLDQRIKADLFSLFIENPERYMSAIAYLRANVDMARANKIAAIKGVRELTRFGLKEAKDTVETFLSNVTFAPPSGFGFGSNPSEPTIGEVIKEKLADKNPCVDTGCLNHAE